MRNDSECLYSLYGWLIDCLSFCVDTTTDIAVTGNKDGSNEQHHVT